MIEMPSTERASLTDLAIERAEEYRTVLWSLAAFGFFVLNGTYIYCVLARLDIVAAAMANSVSLVFMTEVFIFLAFGAWMIARAGLRRPGWFAFVALSIAGGLIFSIPAFLLLHIRKRSG